MALSNDLISQFVKVTKDEKKKATETTAFGTVVEYEGSTWVKLDGSDLLTPVSTTVEATDGDRVTVLIKDHTATITGDLSSPAANTSTVEKIGSKVSEFEIIIADKVDTKDLTAERARIDELVADNVTIKQSLSAAEADVEKLQAEVAEIDELYVKSGEFDSLFADSFEAKIAELDYATVDELNAVDAKIYNLNATHANFESATAKNFEAVNADIGTLEVDNVTIKENLSAASADIDELQAKSLTADSAVIKNLESDVADIDTLIFGSASGTTIQTSFANAVIAQLGNAQIKSAMIDSLAADKISAGSINTNAVTIQSDDGRLVISDETIQISDDARVRVQIGKDASNDYSINIWDADGNLMFSEGGITDSAIKEAIIRNDMVASDANISASKLDISSLFSEINGSTQTINSNKILIDTDSGTLDVAFTSMSNDIEGLDNTVSSQGTRLTAVEGKISSKIWQSDIDDATGEMSTKYSELEQDLDGISATVASHTTDLESVEDKVTTVQTDLSGFKTSVSSTYATKSELGDYSTTVETQALIDASADAIELSVSSTYATKTYADEIKAVADTADGHAKSLDDSFVEIKSQIELLDSSISSIVTGPNGESLMEQTEDGWTFNISGLQSEINKATSDVNDLSSSLATTNENAKDLADRVSSLEVTTEHIYAGTHDGEPCIKMWESDSGYQILITNTRIIFYDGANENTYIRGDTFHSGNVEIEYELRHAKDGGSGQFIWAVRGENGDKLGLVWKEVAE